VSVKAGNYTWANQVNATSTEISYPSDFLVQQSFGGNFESDGRLMGQQDIQTITCNGGSCQVQVPAPSFALVFLSDQALSESDNGAVETFSTSLKTKAAHATVDPSVLATSNGHVAFSNHGGTTSPRNGHENAAFGLAQTLPSLVTLVALVTGGIMIRRIIRT
jgi:hypothetical protein